MNRRILKEIQKGLKSKEFKFTFKNKTGYLTFTVLDGYYKGQIHTLSIKFRYGSNVKYIYPDHPPLVTFVTPIYHPNIDPKGAICLDVIKPEKWSSLYGLETIFNSIISLLNDPNVDSPFNKDAANDFSNLNQEEYKKICQQYYQDNLSE